MEKTDNLSTSYGAEKTVQINPFNNKIILDGMIIRWKREPNALFPNIFKGKKIAKFYNEKDAIEALFQLNRPIYK